MMSILYLLFSIYQFKSICDLKTLRRELEEDLQDNNRIDCLRYIGPPQKSETPTEKNIRLLAQWKSDCAFQSNTNWSYYFGSCFY